MDVVANEMLAARGKEAKVSGKKKNRAINGSPLTRRSVKQRSVGSTHVNMSSTAAAEILGIANIAELDDSVKNV